MIFWILCDTKCLAAHRYREDGRINLLENAVTRLGLSAQARDRILKVARTIADLDESADVQTKHLSEAIRYRTLDRDYWA